MDRHSQPQALAALRLLDLGVTRHAAHLLERHQSGDWGDLEEEDWRENDFAVNRRLWTLSAYGQPPDQLWVITEAGRSVTTILRPDEY